MVTSGVIFAFIGTLLFEFTNSAAIDYEPIKIIVNENFNTQPGQVSSELQAIETGVLHQGASFYFKPQVNLPQNFLPSHIEALISFIQQHQNCSKDPSKFAAEKDKLMEILKPFMNPSLDITKETPSKIVFEKENNLGIVKPQFIPPALEEIGVEPQPVPAIITEEPKPVAELLVIREAPILSLSNVYSLTEEEVKSDESALLKKGMYLTTPEITVQPIQEPIFTYVQTKPITSELLNIPEAPVLPSWSYNGISSNVKKEIIKEESVITEAQRGVFPTISGIGMKPIQESIINYVDPKPIATEVEAIPETLILPPLTANDIKLDEEGRKIEKPIVLNVESKPVIQELKKVIPEAPVLSPLILKDVLSIVKEEVRKEESELLEEPTVVFPTVPEAAVRPAQEPIFNYAEPKPFITELQVIPEAPVLPPLSANDIKLVEDGRKIEEPIVVKVESKPAILELEELIPEAPVLSPPILQNVPSIVKEEVRKEESELLEEPTVVFPTVPEAAVRPAQEPIFNYAEPKPFITELQIIPEAPVLPPLSANYIKTLEEGRKIEEPVVVNVESKPAILELEELIPEAPVLSPPVLQNVPSIVKEEVRKEESELLEEPTVVFPTVPEGAVRPAQELIFNYAKPKPFITELQVIPDAPVLPSLSANDIKLVKEGMKIEELNVVDVESKPAILELEEVIPEIPVLPPLVLQDVSSIVKEEVRKGESELLEEPTVVFPTVPEAAVRPTQELIFNYAKPKPFITELQVIPDAPVLPPLSANYIKTLEEGRKIEEPVVVNVESKPAILELEELIPETPVLSPPVLQNVPSIVKEEVRKEESELLEEPTVVFPTVPEAVVRPAQEPIFNYAEPKPFITELQIIPEAPVLPPLSANYIKTVEEGRKIEEPVVVNVESKPAILELEELIPETPVLSPPVLQNVPSIVKEEVRKEESELLEEPTVVFPTVPEAAVRPAQEPIFNYAEPKPFITELQIIPEAPVLPPLSANYIKTLKEGRKIEEPVVVNVESKPAILELEELIPEAPVLSPPVLQNVPSIVKEEVRKEESELLEEPTVVFPTVPEGAVRPAQELIFNYAKPKPFITELQVIPDAPVLPRLSANDIKLVKEGMKIEELNVVDVESKPAILELEEVIPEIPVLPPLVLQDVSSIVKEEVRKGESELLEEPTVVFPTVPEAAVRPTQELIFNYAKPKPLITELQVIPDAPVLPPLSANYIKTVEEGRKIEEPVVVNVESKPAILELEELIPEAPVLSPPVLQNVPSIVKEEVRKEESELLEEPTVVFPTVPEAVVRPAQEPIFNYAEPKPFTELQVIPEASVLPPLSANDIKLVEEGMNIGEPVVVDIDSKPTIQELEEVIPQAPVLSPLVLQDVPSIVKEEVRKEESELLKEPTGVFPTISEAAVWPVQETIFNYAEPKPFITKLQVIPEAPVLPPLSVNDIKDGMNIEEPINIIIDPKPATSEFGIIPQASILPVVSNIPLVEDVLSEKMTIIAKSTDRPSIPEFFVSPIERELATIDVEPKPLKPNHIIMSESTILPALPFKGKPSVGDEIKPKETIKIEESTGIFTENSARPISEPITVSESVKQFVLENNKSPVATKVNIEIPILLEESIEVIPPIAERPSEQTLEPLQELKMTNPYVLEDVSLLKPEHVIQIKETVPPRIIPRPSNNLGVFSYEPFVSHLSNRVVKLKKLSIPKGASLERFLLKKHPFRLPIMSFPKLSLNAMKSPIRENKKQFLYTTSYANDIVEKRIAPGMGFKRYAPPKHVKMYLRSQVPKGPSYL